MILVLDAVLLGQEALASRCSVHKEATGAPLGQSGLQFIIPGRVFICRFPKIRAPFWESLQQES